MAQMENTLTVRACRYRHVKRKVDQRGYSKRNCKLCSGKCVVKKCGGQSGALTRRCNLERRNLPKVTSKNVPVVSQSRAMPIQHVGEALRASSRQKTISRFPASRNRCGPSITTVGKKWPYLFLNAGGRYNAFGRDVKTRRYRRFYGLWRATIPLYLCHST